MTVERRQDHTTRRGIAAVALLAGIAMAMAWVLYDGTGVSPRLIALPWVLRHGEVPGGEPPALARLAPGQSASITPTVKVTATRVGICLEWDEAESHLNTCLDAAAIIALADPGSVVEETDFAYGALLHNSDRIALFFGGPGESGIYAQPIQLTTMPSETLWFAVHTAPTLVDGKLSSGGDRNPSSQVTIEAYSGERLVYAERAARSIYEIS